MTTNIHSTDQMAARSLRTYALTMIVGPLLALVMVINSGINVLWPWYAVTGISMISLVSIIKFPNMGQAKSSAFFIAIFVFACLASSVNSHIIAETKMPQTIFGAYKVGAMFIALIAPAPAWLGYALISFCIVIPPLQALTVSPEVLNLATQSEPWYTIIYTTARNKSQRKGFARFCQYFFRTS